MHNTRPADLLRTKRFLPYFLTQALGAFNDNVFKNALLLLIAFGAIDKMDVDINLIMNLAAGLFILPFFIMSPTAGQIADKYEKSALIRRIKLAEIGIMILAALAFWTESYWTLLLILFLMGTQSAFFGPVKYSILPQTLDQSELVGGNALVELGTFLAILFGTILAGILVSLSGAVHWVSVSVVAFAVLGYLASRRIPRTAAADPSISINWNLGSELLHLWRQTRQNPPVLVAILAISWFWFLGASYLTQFPNFAKETLQGNAAVVTLLLTLFSVGIAIGSLLCEKLSGKRVEPGIVPIGALGLTLCGADLAFAAGSLPAAENGLRDAWSFIQTDGSLRVMLDLAGIGVFGGLFIVPLYALIQQRADPKRRAQAIAANNVVNAAFMVISAIVGILCLTVLSLNIPDYFLTLALLNLLYCSSLFWRSPEYLSRLRSWLLLHSRYRINTHNFQGLPDEGPVVVLCPQLQGMQPALIFSLFQRPVELKTKQLLSSPQALDSLLSKDKVIALLLSAQEVHDGHDAKSPIRAHFQSLEVPILALQVQTQPGRLRQGVTLSLVNFE